MKWAIVINPYSGKRRGMNLGHEFRKLAVGKEIAIVWICGATAQESRDLLAAEVKAGGLDAVVVVGGDGLVNLVVQELAKTQIGMAVIAAGTGNDFARANGTFDMTVPELFQLMATTSPSAIDLGKVEVGGEQKWFCQILSTGFDSVVNERANRFLRLHGKMKYNIATVIELPRFSPIEYQIEIDGAKQSTKAMLVAIANGPTYGGGMKVCPDADRKDGLFDVLILHPLPKLEFIAVFPKVFKGTHVTHPKVEIFRAKKLTLSAPARAYADGEDYGSLPLTVTSEPQCLLTWSR
ncbi:MAG: YegS/Rv2252/BmrU family lipid kinase [Actinomycetes bacterium]